MALSRIIFLLLVTLAALLGVMVFRAEVYFPYPSHIEECNQTHEPIAGQQLVDRFTQALRIKTITRQNRDYDGEPLQEFALFLSASK